MQMVRFWTVWICTRGRTFAPFGLEPSGMVGMRLVVPWLVFDRRNLREDYVICGEMWCIPLEKLVPRARAPVVEIAPC